MLWQIRTLLHDTKLMFSGMADIVRYARDVDNIETSISLFSTPSHIVGSERGCDYEVVIANATPSDCFQTLLIDIYLRDKPIHPDGHYAFFDKTILLRKRGNTTVRISYDWKDRATLLLEKAVVPPDHFWRGECNALEKYVIRATLFGTGGEPCEELTLVQKLIA